MAKERMKLVVSGLVQGVFFRAYTIDMARKWDLAGWVRNRSDGAVEIVAEGERENLEELLKWAHHGPPSAHVKNVDVHFEIFTGELKGFSVRY